MVDVIIVNTDIDIDIPAFIELVLLARCYSGFLVYVSILCMITHFIVC